MTAKKKQEDAYGAEQISILEGLEPVRKRPGMYIGSTGVEGLHTLIREIFDNSRDEAMAGYANRIEVALLPGNIVRVVDNGRGIPVDKHKKTGVSALDTIMTTLHAGGKFGDGGYKISGGLHGVGASVVNALSEWTQAAVHKDGSRYIQEYSRGIKQDDVKKKGKTDHQGTIIAFQADPEIFPEINYSWKWLVQHMRGQAYLVKGLTIHCIDLRESGIVPPDDVIYLYDEVYDAPSQTFYFEGGLLSLVRFLNKPLKTIGKKIFYTQQITNPESGEAVEVALQYTDDISSRISAYANNIPNPEGGFHLTGFKTALTRVVNNYAKKNTLIKEKDGSLTGDDLLEGLTAVISVHLADPQFEGQTKGKLGSTEAKGMVESAFGEALAEFLEENPDDAKAIINKGLLAMRARAAAKAAKDSVLRKGALEGLTLPGKLADCQTKSAEESELFIVEGDSAGGSAKTGRDRRTQAILPLRGKVLNVERARLDKMLASEQIKNMVIAFGTGIGDTFDIEKLRYHKIIIATDADVDGEHITTLLLTLFYRHFKPIIEGGYLYVANPPLYKVEIGKEKRYLQSEEELQALYKELALSEEEEDAEEDAEDGDFVPEKKRVMKTKDGKKVTVGRYKGLGEMDADELYETTMDINNRILRQVTIDDAAEADKVFDVLMGTEVAPRKAFIVANAKLAEIDM
ncbi:MAG: DNA gyrase/topoisomerase IV subunit B [Patescibacteria group bacterium]